MGEKKEEVIEEVEKEEVIEEVEKEEAGEEETPVADEDIEIDPELKRIRQNRLKVLADEMGEEPATVEEEEAPPVEGASPEDTGEPEDEAEDAAAGDDEEEEEDTPAVVEMVTIVVDGEKREVPLSDVMDAGKRTLQKESAADKRLREAAEMREQATKLLEAAGRRVEEQLPEEGAAPSPISDEERERVATLAESILYGEEEERNEALAEVIGMGRVEATPSDDRVLALIHAELHASEIRNKLSASPESGGYADIMSDPYLFSIASARVDALLQEGQPNSWELYAGVCDEVRAWRDGLVKDTPAEKKLGDDIKAKGERKKSIDTVTSVTAKSPSTVKPEKKVSLKESRSERARIIASSRGQAIGG